VNATADYIVTNVYEKIDGRWLIVSHHEAALGSQRAQLGLGPFQRALAGVRGVDAVAIDPPYDEGSLPLLRELALWTDRVLKPDGVLAVTYWPGPAPAGARAAERRTFPTGGPLPF
jgi:16S rRNA G966 N2-methylase RsmD